MDHKNVFHDISDPVAFAHQRLGFTPQGDQARLLATKHRYVLLNCHRQWGKTTLTSIRAVHRAVTLPQQQVVILAPTMRQSQILAGRCREYSSKLNLPLKTDGKNPGSLIYPNGSAILPPPAHPDRVRGFTANLLIIDEAARVPDEVYAAATPMLATTQGDLWLLSTPHGRRGFFYEEWMAQEAARHPWLRILGQVGEHPGRMERDFLHRERQRKTAEQFAEEYGCEFVTAGRNVFLDEWLDNCFTGEIPMFDENSREDLRLARHRPIYYLGLDIGKLRDHAAFVLLEYRVIPTGKRDAASFQPLYKRELRVVLAEQFRIKTAYRDVIARLQRLCNHPHLAGYTNLLLDATGKGEPLEEMVRDAKLPVTLVPISITAGGKVGVNGSWRMVPKVDLVTNLEFLLERGLIKISTQMPQSDLLRNELRQFERRSNRGGHLTYGAGSGHDDLVSGFSMAAWWAWRNRKGALTGPELKALD